MAYKRKTKEEREAELKEAMEKIQQGIDNINSQESWIDYLNFKSMFHSYSVRNTILIKSQCPYASQVASFKA